MTLVVQDEKTTKESSYPKTMRENTVILKGWVIVKPKIEIEPKTGKYTFAKIFIRTVRRGYMKSSKELRGEFYWDTMCIYSRDSDFIKEYCLDIKENNIVELKGVLCTEEITKKYVCPHCGSKIERDGAVLSYINPYYIKKCIYEDKEGNPKVIFDKEEYKDYLETDYEFSNQVFIMGRLCREPKFYSDDVIRQCQIQIASNRYKKIAEDPDDKDTDYPWIKAFGSKAVEYKKVLHTNSKIYVNGAIQTIEYEQRVVCDECLNDFTGARVSTEIIPYHIEYMENCDLSALQDKEQILSATDEYDNSYE